ncbi:uncharacterized protein LOC127245882 [Andrographis paniculata]|uniref:uncharacterized protein LOC127245882 n=1 Tax=Andrographis paniculata TaxID=175694 RepID=UPI0021E92A59|nr:uncharacterized protein LOC127245882 [Andrographis paniculata]
MECLRIALVVFVLVCRSDGSSLGNFRHLSGIDRHSDTINQVSSPSPSPSPSENSDSVKTGTPANQRKGAENCKNVANKCDFKDYQITACVIGNGSQPPHLLVFNGGSSSHKVTISVPPAVDTLKNITVAGKDVQKVNLSSIMEVNSSIAVKIGNLSCVLPIGASIPQQSYYRYATPTYGAYLFFMVAVCLGGTWAGCKIVKQKRHLDGGAAYQELELGERETDSSFVIEAPEGWDETWDDDDDDWDEEKAVRSPGANKDLQNGGASLKYIDTSQWGNDWDD